MSNLDKILSIEANNGHAIYLYLSGDKWLAYEQSAFHFSQLFKMGEIEKVGQSICVAIDEQFEFLNSKAMCAIEITSVADSEIKIDCKENAFKGFEQWKQKHLS